MRYIRQQEIGQRIPGDWQNRAAAALAAVRAAQPRDRAGILRVNASLWAELKPLLAEVTSRKCWYCESREKRSDNAVDHFRPKNRVVERKEHPGYWWLAFDWENYRYSCTFCNSKRAQISSEGGKHDHFPLLSEAHRAMDETADVDLEQPVLLDPTDEADPELLWFIDDGTAVPKFEETESNVRYLRASESIRLYHLNHRDLVEARKELFGYIRTLVQRGTKFFGRDESDYRASLEDLREIIGDLRQLLDDDEELSSAARAMVINLRDANHKWLDAVLWAA